MEADPEVGAVVLHQNFPGSFMSVHPVYILLLYSNGNRHCFFPTVLQFSIPLHDCIVIMKIMMVITMSDHLHETIVLWVWGSTGYWAVFLFGLSRAETYQDVNIDSTL